MLSFSWEWSTSHVVAHVGVSRGKLYPRIDLIADIVDGSGVGDLGSEGPGRVYRNILQGCHCRRGRPPSKDYLLLLLLNTCYGAKRWVWLCLAHLTLYDSF